MEVNIKKVEGIPEESVESSIEKVSSEKLREISGRLVTRLRQLRSQQERSQWEQEKAEAFASYHMQEPKKSSPYDGYPNLRCPLHRIYVDTLHSNTLFTFAGQSGNFTVMPEFMSKGNISEAERSAKFMSTVLNHECGLYDSLDKAGWDSWNYGTGYIEAYYCRKYKWETREVEEEVAQEAQDPVTGMPVIEFKKRKRTERIKKTIFDGVKTRRVPVESIYVSPFFESLEEAVERDVVYKVSIFDMRDIKRMSKKNGNKEPFFNPKAVSLLVATTKARLSDSALQNEKKVLDGFMLDAMTDEKRVELAEAHLWEDLNGDEVPEKIAVVFDTESGTILRISYGEMNIVELRPRPVDGRFHGESVYRAGYPIAVEWEAIHNARVAKGQWANTPFGFYRQGSRLNPSAITFMPGHLYPVDNTQDISFPQLPSPDLSYYQEEKLLTEYGERINATGDVIQGVSGSGASTATETLNTQQRAGIRLATPMNRIGNALTLLTEKIWELYRKHGPEEKEFKIAGVGNGTPIFDRISRKEYAAQLKFKLSMATLFDVQLARDTAMLNYQTFVQNPMVLNNPAAFFQLTKRTMKATGLEIDIPAPPQANTKAPEEEHELIRQGELIEPVVGEDTDHHLKTHDKFILTDEFKEWPEDKQLALLIHRDKTKIQKQLLQAGNLNQSGIYEGAPQAPGGSFTSNRNPTQLFNTARVDNSAASKRQNVQNGVTGA